MKWPQKNLGDLAIVSSGDGAPQDASDFGNSGLPFVRAGSLSLLLEGRPESELELIPKAISSNRRMNIFPAKTVLFAKSGMSCTKGLVYQLKSPAHVVNHLAAIQCGNDLDSRFLLRWFEANSPARLIANEAYPSIKISDIRAEKIPLPPLPEQKRIAAILDKADSLRTKRRETIKQLDKLARAVFIEMFGDPVTNPKGWETVPLGSIADLENGDRSSNYPSGPDILEAGVLFLSTKNISSNRLVFDSLQFISEEKFRSLSRGKLRKNDLVITLRGTLGSCAIFDCEYQTGFINAQLLILHPRKKVIPIYLHAFLTTPRMQSLYNELATGVAVKQLTAKQIGELSVSLPPPDFQQRFASIIASIEQHKTRRQTQLTELDALFTSLQARAFTGEL